MSDRVIKSFKHQISSPVNPAFASTTRDIPPFPPARFLLIDPQQISESGQDQILSHHHTNWLRFVGSRPFELRPWHFQLKPAPKSESKAQNPRSENSSRDDGLAKAGQKASHRIQRSRDKTKFSLEYVGTLESANDSPLPSFRTRRKSRRNPWRTMVNTRSEVRGLRPEV